MKHLIIDAGNTYIKLVVYQEQRVFLSSICTGVDIAEKMEKFFLENKISKVILSSVGPFTGQLKVLLKDVKELLVLDAATKVPFINLYQSPKTLGVDRIALVSAASTQYPSQNVLVIDAGTCVTYDFKNSKNEYLGGAISPGLQMRYRALHTFTEKLPKLKTVDQKEYLGEEWLGTDTESSIHSGVVNGLVCEIEGVIDQYKSQFANLTVVLTGGDLDFLSSRLKSEIFAHSNFLTKGLNDILTYNTTE